MSTVQIQVVHDCDFPEVEDVTMRYQFTCDCGSLYEYSWGHRWTETVHYGFFRHKSKEVVREKPGTWQQVRSTPEFSFWIDQDERKPDGYKYA